MKLADVQVAPDEYGSRIDLGKFVGKKVLRVEGRASSNFGKNTMVFQLSRIVFDDGTFVFIEGEHDCPYIPTGSHGCSEKALLELYDLENPGEES